MTPMMSLILAEESSMRDIASTALLISNKRKDEIGAIANAVERFKIVADEKARHEANEATQRQQAQAAVQAKAAEERQAVAEVQSEAFRALGVGLAKLSGGDLMYRLDESFPA